MRPPARAQSRLTSDRSVRAVAVAAILAVSVSIGAPPQSALASCSPPRDHDTNAYQAGVVGQPDPYPDGVQAVTDEYNPYYTGSNPTGSLMSVMLDHGTQMWAQVGWIKHKVSGNVRREVFIEHVDGFGNNDFMFWTQKPVGSTTNYKITYDPSNGRFSYYVAGSNYAGMNSNTAIRPTRWEIFGETHDGADQMPGGTNAHAKFRSAKISLHGSSVWSSANGTVHYNGTPYNKASGSLGSFDVWDVKCSS